MLHVWKALIKTDLDKDKNSFRITKNKIKCCSYSFYSDKQTRNYFYYFLLKYTSCYLYNRNITNWMRSFCKQAFQGYRSGGESLTNFQI